MSSASRHLREQPSDCPSDFSTATTLTLSFPPPVAGWVEWDHDEVKAKAGAPDWVHNWVANRPRAWLPGDGSTPGPQPEPERPSGVTHGPESGVTLPENGVSGVTLGPSPAAPQGQRPGTTSMDMDDLLANIEVHGADSVQGEACRIEIERRERKRKFGQ